MQDDPNFLGVRGFGVQRAGYILTSASRHGSVKSGAHYFRYFTPSVRIPDFVFRKGPHYGFQSIHLPDTYVDYPYIGDPAIVGLVKSFGTVRQYERTYVSSHMIILHLWSKHTNPIVISTLADRYQCEVSPYDIEEIKDYATWPNRAGV